MINNKNPNFDYCNWRLFKTGHKLYYIMFIFNFKTMARKLHTSDFNGLKNHTFSENIKNVVTIIYKQLHFKSAITLIQI